MTAPADALYATGVLVATMKRASDYLDLHIESVVLEDWTNHIELTVHGVRMMVTVEAAQ